MMRTMELEEFVIGRVYRRLDINEKYGGSRQSGISNSAKAPAIFLFSGEEGEQHGYHDGYQADGTFHYSGEGQVGDMRLERGNKAIVESRQDGKQIFLFEKVASGRHKFGGEFEYLGLLKGTGLDREGNRRTILTFVLGLVSAGTELGEAPDLRMAEESIDARSSLEELRRRALASTNSDANFSMRKQVAHERSSAIRDYVRLRAGGNCEGCGEVAPFTTPKGKPYLEAHHIRRLVDGGPDHPLWVIALCPNCHKRVHHGDDGAEYNATLARRVAMIESRHSGAVI